MDVGTFACEGTAHDRTRTERPAVARAQAESVIAKWQGGRGSLIGLLQAVQAELGYVPPDSLPAVAEKLGLPLSQVCSVATFYGSFSLVPRGEHIVTCCVGTACHVRGSARVISELSRLLGVEPGETTADREFTFETVRCLGACALAPVVVVDGKFHGKMTPGKVRRLLQETRRGDEDDE